MKLLSYDWSDYGYFVGISLVFGFYYHWSHFIITAMVVIFSIAGLRNSKLKRTGDGD